MIVLDASAVLALVHDDVGAATVATQLDGSVIGAANLAEVIGTLVDAGIPVAELRQLLAASGVTIEPVTEADAELAGALRAMDTGRTLSLGDRLCLALALRYPTAEVLTSDLAWADLDLPLTIHLIR